MNNYIDDINYLHVVGEIINNTDSNYNYIKVVASFKNDSGQTIDTNFSYSELDVLSPGQSTPFKISIKNKDKIKKYSVQVQGQPGGSKRDLKILDTNSYMDDIGYFHITGQIKNSTGQTADYVKVVATYYDNNKEVIDTNFSYTEIDKIPAGDTSPFKISIKNKSKIKSYKVQVQ